MLKKDDIFIDWSLWSVAGPIVLSILWFEYGLSSNQVRTNDVRNVVLLVVDPSSIHHYIFWGWPMLSPCSHDGGSPVIWKFRWVVVEPIDNIFISSMMLLNIKLVLETFESISFMLAHEVLVWRKKWLPLIHVHFDVSCRREFEKACFYLLWNHPKSVMHVRSILWFDRLIIFIPYVYPSTSSHRLICSRRRSNFIRANPNLWKNFDILDDGSQPELGSV